MTSISASASPLNNGKGYAFPTTPIELPKTVCLPDSVLNVLIRRFSNSSDEEIQRNKLRELTKCPGQRDPVVTQIADCFTRIINPDTKKPFIAPDDIEEEMELSGKILKALKSFQRIFMDMKESDISLGYLSPMECSRILTIDAGTMLTQIPIRNSKTGTYLAPQDFNKLDNEEKIKAPDGSSNPIYTAFVNFLTNEYPLDAKKEDAAASIIISKWNVVKMHWRKLKQAHLLR